MVHESKDLTASLGSQKRTINNVSGWHCPVCGEVEFDAGEGQRYAKAIKDLQDEAMKADAAFLKRVRERLRLSQTEAGKITGGGRNVYGRYERAEVRPMRAVVNLFLALDHQPELLQFFYAGESVETYGLSATKSSSKSRKKTGIVGAGYSSEFSKTRKILGDVSTAGIRSAASVKTGKVIVGYLPTASGTLKVGGTKTAKTVPVLQAVAAKSAPQRRSKERKGA